MKLLLDEMIAPVVARELGSRGHDVQAVGGHSDRERLSCREVMDVARHEHRAVVTNNLRDYRPLHHEAVAPGGPGHFGMIFMPGGYRRTTAEVGRIVAALDTNLAEYPGERDLANGESWL